jgi:transposase
MKQYSEAFVGFDTAKKNHAVAVADVGREGEIRYLGEIDSSPAAVERMTRKLAGRYEKLHFCYEAGPTGYGLYRQVGALGRDCTVVAPSLIPKKSDERIKTNRRDAVTLARLFRAGELTSVWVPDTVHEAVRELVRAREAASQDLRRKRQQLLSFLLRHGRIFSGRQHWSRAHLHWLAQQQFDHPAQQIVFEDAVDTIDDAATRLRRLDEQVAAIVPSWSMASVVEACQAMRGVSLVVAVTFVAPLRQSPPIDGLPRSGPIGAVDRREGSACRPHPGRQQTRPAGADRGRLELSLSGPRQSPMAGSS